MSKVLLFGVTPPAFLMGAQAALISARAGGGLIDRRRQAGVLAVWTVMAMIPLLLLKHWYQLAGCWIYPAAMAAGWAVIFGFITAKEYAEEADMTWYHFRRDLPKHKQKLRKLLSRA